VGTGQRVPVFSLIEDETLGLVLHPFDLATNRALAIAQRQRYSHAEVATLDFHDHRPDAVLLGSQWHLILEEAARTVSTLPPEELGTGAMDNKGELCTASAPSLKIALHEGRILFHTGSIGGVWPQIKDQS
jgi:hypothetical protein